MSRPAPGRAVVVLLVALLAAGGTAGCGRVEGRRPVASPVSPTVTAADQGAPASGVDPATVSQVEQQVDGAQRFLDGAEAQLGQDGR